MVTLLYADLHGLVLKRVFLFQHQPVLGLPGLTYIPTGSLVTSPTSESLPGPDSRLVLDFALPPSIGGGRAVQSGYGNGCGGNFGGGEGGNGKCGGDNICSGNSCGCNGCIAGGGYGGGKEVVSNRQYNVGG